MRHSRRQGLAERIMFGEKTLGLGFSPTIKGIFVHVLPRDFFKVVSGHDYTMRISKGRQLLEWFE